MSKSITFSKIVMFFFLLLQSAFYAQGDNSNQNFDSKAELNSQIKIPKSPEAEAFEKYGNTAVNIYTGTPDINIPLHTLKGREFEIPMTLNYDASGIKVSQIATNVGLGWNLVCGGRISRIANGMPDDVAATSPYDEGNRQQILDKLSNGINQFSNSEELHSYLQGFMKQVNDGSIDTQLDFYSLNAIGINDYIVIDLQDGTLHTLLNPRIQVEHLTEEKWKIIGEDGTEYIFNNVQEVTRVTTGSDAAGAGLFSGESTSSWLLTEIRSKNKLDVFTFDYKLYEWDSGFIMPLSSKSFSRKLLCDNQNMHGDGGWDLFKEFTTSQQMPFKIYLNGETLVEFTYKGRNDLIFKNSPYQSGNAIDEILFYKFKTTSASFKKIRFIHEYFGNVSGSYKEKRLKLKGLLFYNYDITKGKKYSFEYIGEELPSNIPPIDSYAQDLLGLYNGQNNNPNLIPKVNYDSTRWTTGANRDFNLSFATVGTLNKITYPTKGYTEFTYEQNDLAGSSSQHDPSYTTYESILSFKSSEGWCETIPAEYWNVNSNMQLVDKTEFGEQILSYAYCNTVRSTLLDITETASYKFSAIGKGFYLIQSISGCESPETLEITDCFYDNNGEPISETYYPCLHPTSSLYITTPTNYSFPADYVKGGLIGYDTHPMNDINLPIGKYQVTLWSYPVENNNTGNFDFQQSEMTFYKTVRHEFPIETHYTKKFAEGFRIKSITDYTAAGQLAKSKEYLYQYSFNLNDSSGIQLGALPSAPISSTLSHGCGGCVNLEQMTVTSGGISNSPNVGYESVYEIQKSNSDNNGYVLYKFNVGLTGLIYSTGATSFEPVFQNGKIKEKSVFNKNNSVVSLEKTIYEDKEFYSQDSFSYVQNSGPKGFPWAKNGVLYFHYPSCHMDGLINIPGPVGPDPHWDDHADWADLILGGYSSVPVIQTIKGRYGYIKSKETINYTSSGEIKQTESYSYEDQLPYRLLTKKVSTSSNNKIETYTYHDDFPLNPEKIITVVTSSNEAVLSTRENVYSYIGSNNEANFVTEIKTAKGDEGLESRLLFDYDPESKNITSVLQSPSNDIVSSDYESYIFGYDNRFPVVKLKGIKYTDIPAELIQSIQEKTNVPCTEANNNLLNQAFNNLRSALPNVQITTYMYDPVIGVTRQTDINGIKTSYEYDELGRLVRIIDNDRNIVSEHEYNYRNQ